MLRDNDSEMGHLTRDTSSDAVCKEYHGGSHQDQNLRQRKKGLEPAWRIRVLLSRMQELAARQCSPNRTYFFSWPPETENGEVSRDDSTSPRELASDSPVRRPGPKGAGFETPKPWA